MAAPRLKPSTFQGIQDLVPELHVQSRSFLALYPSSTVQCGGGSGSCRRGGQNGLPPQPACICLLGCNPRCCTEQGARQWWLLHSGPTTTSELAQEAHFPASPHLAGPYTRWQGTLGGDKDWSYSPSGIWQRGQDGAYSAAQQQSGQADPVTVIDS